MDGPDGALLGRYVNGVTTPQMPVYPGTPVNKLSAVGSPVSIPSTLQVGADGGVTAPVTVVDTALTTPAGATNSVVAGPVASPSAGVVVKSAAAVSQQVSASRVSQHAADDLFTALARGAVEPDESAILGSGEQAVREVLASQMGAAGSAQTNLDSLLWESGDSSWQDGKQDWLS